MKFALTLKIARKTKLKPIVVFRLLIASVVLLIALIVGIILISDNSGTDDVIYSTAGLSGNTAGNLYNKGLFCEKYSRIYFSNINDDGNLYSMDLTLSDFKKICDDKVRYINVDENYIFYSRINNQKLYSNSGVFVFYTNGIFRRSITNYSEYEMLTSNPLGSLLLYNNKLIYQYYEENEALSMQTLELNGDPGITLYTDDAPAVSVYSNRLYYADSLNDHYIHSITLDGRDPRVEVLEYAYQPIATKDGIYYISTLNNYKIYRADYDGNTECVVDSRCSSFNISKDLKKIYYIHDGSDDNGIRIYDLTEGTDTQILGGDYKWINLVSGYCFFYNFNGDVCYVYMPDGSVNVFNPPTKG